MYEYWQQQAQFRSNGQIGVPMEKLLISLLNEQTHIATFILHSTSYFFHYVTNSTVLCYKSVTLNNNKTKWGWTVIYNPTKNPIKLEENWRSPNAYTFYKNKDTPGSSPV